METVKAARKAILDNLKNARAYINREIFDKIENLSDRKIFALLSLAICLTILTSFFPRPNKEISVECKCELLFTFADFKSSDDISRADLACLESCQKSVISPIF